MRARQTAGLSATLRAPADLQKQAEAGDSRMQSALRNFQTAELHFEAVTAKVRQTIAQDDGVKDAERKAKSAATDLSKAKEALAKEQKQFDAAQAALAREKQQYQQAQASENKKKSKK